MNPKYSKWPIEDLATNEYLDAIICGLNLNSNNSVLAICGSGDQAFAMLEKTNNLHVVDMREKQIEYFLYRKSLIERGEFGEFLIVSEEEMDKEDKNFVNARNKYLTIKRLTKIRSNLEKGIEITNSKIENLGRGKFDRIYLSNSLSYGGIYLDFLYIEKELKK